MPNDIFEEVKRQVNLRSYLDRRWSLKRCGSGTWRINPCPLCSHNDSFTYNEPKNTIACYSCGFGGDIIEFESRMNGHKNMFDAAKAVAASEGILIDGVESKQKRTSSPSSSGPVPEPPGYLNADDNPPAPKKKPETPKPEIEFERGCVIREFAADYFHRLLLADAQALAYQTDKRKHSVDILKQERVGLAGGDLIGAAGKHGITPEELHAIGLANPKKNGGGWWPAMRKGFYVYPHVGREGKVLFFSMKDPTKKHRFQVRKAAAAEGWLCLGQEALNHHEPIVIVEGEDDRLSVMDRGGYPMSSPPTACTTRGPSSPSCARLQKTGFFICVLTRTRLSGTRKPVR